jgi:hypothetical protein
MNGHDQVTVSIVGGANEKEMQSGPIMSGTLATTPANQPNLLINVVPPVLAVTVRFIHLFLTTFVGLLTVAGVGGADTFGAVNFNEVFRTCAIGGLSVAGMGALKDIITIFGRLEGKYPLVTGSI